jgi:hypothetical protein
VFIDENKLREKDETGLIENLLRKKEGDIVKINIEEKLIWAMMQQV